jgi:hypothetical protein
VQTLREVQRAKTSKRIFGVISKLNKDLTNQDWWTLKLTALFHDLAKGRKGDHSSEGAKLVDQYFSHWRYADHLKDDVHWLVENHLLMSTASFRQNPQAQTTWKRLFARGVEGRRMVLLALFTAIDIRATLVGGSYSDTDSSEMAFKIAASMAFKDAVQRGAPAILEPVMSVEVICPDDYMGSVVGDLNSRRGKILNLSVRHGMQLIKAEVPLATMFGYSTALRSSSQGRATFTMEFSHYGATPPNIANEIKQRLGILK